MRVHSRSTRLCASACVALLASCDNRMLDQRKLEPLEASAYFVDGRSARRPPPGTVPAGPPRDSSPPEITRELLDRGRDRYDVFCSPCHGAAGYGEGIVVRRGFARPASFHDAALRARSDAAIYRAIRDGRGAMASFAAELPPKDRWAVVAWIRALQRSQNASLGDVPEAARETLEEDR